MPATVKVAAVRFQVEMVKDEDGRIGGQLRADGGDPVPYSGWLELLRLLEDRAEVISERGVPAPPRGDDWEEKR